MWDNSLFVNKWDLATTKEEKKKLLKTVAKSNHELFQYENLVTSYKYSLIPSGYSHLDKDPKILLDNFTTDDAILYYSSQGYTTWALNFANAHNPGGGYLNGAM